MADHTFSNTRIGSMLKEARESGDQRLETRALYIWGCRVYRRAMIAKAYWTDRTATRDFKHAWANWESLPWSIKTAVRKTYDDSVIEFRY